MARCSPHSAERTPCGGAKGGHRTTKVGKAGELLGVLEMAHQHVHSRCRLEHSLVVSVRVDTTHTVTLSVLKSEPYLIRSRIRHEQHLARTRTSTGAVMVVRAHSVRAVSL